MPHPSYTLTGWVVFQMARKYNMVIVSSILERDELHGEVLANTAGESFTFFLSFLFTLCFIKTNSEYCTGTEAH